MFIGAINNTYFRWAALFLTALLTSFFISSFVTSSVSAQNKDELCTGANLTFNTSDGKDCNKDASGKSDCPQGTSGNCAENSFNKIVATIVNVFSIIVGIAAVIMIIYGGFRYITSGGDSGNISTAKNIIIYAIVGLIIVALAQVIVKFVLDKVAT